MADLNSLKQDAGIIRDASQSQENTAFRVGSWLVSLIEFLTDTTIEAVITGIAHSVNADGIVLNISYQKADGSTFTSMTTIPIATVDKAGLFSPTMVAELAKLRTDVNASTSRNNVQDTTIAGLQSDVSAVKTKNTSQDSRIDGVENIAKTANNAVETLGADVSIVKSNIATLQSEVASLKSKNTSQDSRINSVENTAEMANIAIETIGGEMSIVKSNIATLQQSLASNASDIDALQKANVNLNEALSKHTSASDEHFSAIERFHDHISLTLEELDLTVSGLRDEQRVFGALCQSLETQISACNNLAATNEGLISNLADEINSNNTSIANINATVATINKDIYDVNEAMRAISQKVNNAESTLEDIKANGITETYVLNFTIKDGTNTGAFSEEEYTALRKAIEDGKLIVISGAATRNTADSQAMAADYVVIRYATPRINDNNSITVSYYELIFSATEYTTKAIHKSLTN